MKTAPLVLTTLLLRFVCASSLNLRAGDEAVKIVGERILTNDLVSLDHRAIVLLSYISSILTVIWCLSTSLRSHTSPQLLVSLLEVSCYLDNACRHSHLRFNLFQVSFAEGNWLVAKNTLPMQTSTLAMLSTSITTSMISFNSILSVSRKLQANL